MNFIHNTPFFKKKNVILIFLRIFYIMSGSDSVNRSGSNRAKTEIGIQYIANGTLAPQTSDVKTTNNSMVYNAADLLVKNANVSLGELIT